MQELFQRSGAAVLSSTTRNAWPSIPAPVRSRNNDRPASDFSPEETASGENVIAVPPANLFHNHFFPRPTEFRSNRKYFFIGHSTVCLFYAGMGVGQQAGTKEEWWVGAADQINRRALARRSVQARRDEQHAKNARIAVVLSLFLVLLGAALLVGGRGVVDPLLRAVADERESKRMGEIVYTMADGAYCRHLSFDNMSGEVTERAIQLCTGENIARPRTRNAIGFAWGQR